MVRAGERAPTLDLARFVSKISICRLGTEVNGVDVSESRKKNTKSENLLLRMEPDMIARIDELRRQVPDIPTRQEMIRRILADMLYGADKPDGSADSNE